MTRAATTAHLYSLAQREPSRLSALIKLVGERQRSGGPGAATRALSDLEEAWAAVLALDEGSGTVEEDGARRLRAREARVNGLVRSQHKGASLLSRVVNVPLSGSSLTRRLVHAVAPVEELLAEVEQVAQRASLSFSLSPALETAQLTFPFSSRPLVRTQAISSSAFPSTHSAPS